MCKVIGTDFSHLYINLQFGSLNLPRHIKYTCEIPTNSWSFSLFIVEYNMAMNMLKYDT